METIGQRMKKIRTEQNMSVSEVADKAKIPISTYREWENGRQIKGEPYEKIADALGISLNQLMTGKSGDSKDILPVIDQIQSLCVQLKNC